MAENQRVMVTITEAQAERLDRITAETAVSRSAVLSLALSDYLAKWEQEHPQTGSQAATELPQPVRDLIAAYMEHLDEEHMRYVAWDNGNPDHITDGSHSVLVEKGI